MVQRQRVQRRRSGGAAIAAVLILSGCASPPPPAVVADPPVSVSPETTRPEAPVVRVPLQCADLFTESLITSVYETALPAVDHVSTRPSTPLQVAAQRQNGDLWCAWATGSTMADTSYITVEVAPYTSDSNWDRIVPLITGGPGAGQDAITMNLCDTVCVHLARIGDYAVQVETGTGYGMPAAQHFDALVSAVTAAVAAVDAPPTAWSNTLREGEAQCNLPFEVEPLLVPLEATAVEDLQRLSTEQGLVSFVSRSEVGYGGCYFRATRTGRESLDFTIEYLPDAAWAMPQLRDAHGPDVADLTDGSGFTFAHPGSQTGVVATYGDGAIAVGIDPALDGYDGTLSRVALDIVTALLPQAAS